MAVDGDVLDAVLAHRGTASWWIHSETRRHGSGQIQPDVPPRQDDETRGSPGWGARSTTRHAAARCWTALDGSEMALSTGGSTH